MAADLTALTGLDVPTGLLIGGEWGGGKGGGTFPVLDPATEEPLAEVADGTVRTRSTRSARRTTRCPAGPRPRRGSAARCCARRSS